MGVYWLFVFESELIRHKVGMREVCMEIHSDAILACHRRVPKQTAEAVQCPQSDDLGAGRRKLLNPV